MRKIKNIGFISTRIAGTDGVSLEIEKWATVLERNNFKCFYFAGELDRPTEISFLVEEAHFKHPEIQEINNAVYGCRERPREISERIQELKDYLKQKIYEFVEEFEIDLIIPENALSISLNIPLGLAITEFIAETGIPVIAHHHDFYWERDYFLVNAVNDYLHASFPPDLPNIQHVVINSLASEQLSHRKGISNTIIPNVYDFSSPPDSEDEYCLKLKEKIGLNEKDPFILQPTRVIPRKCIERSIEIVSFMKLDNPILVISHSIEENLYTKRIIEYAHNLGVKLVFIHNIVGRERKTLPDGKEIYTIGDVYRCADLVTYPSSYEGFGNAFLEAIYYRKPILVNRYSIYKTDIEPKGFDVIAIDGIPTNKTIEEIYKILQDKERRERMVEKNYKLASKYFSYEILEKKLLHLIEQAKVSWR